MNRTGTAARWTASTGASLVLMVVVALVAAPVVGAGPGDGGGSDPIAGLIGGDGPGFSGGGNEGGGHEGGGDGKHGGGRGGDGQAVRGRAMSRGETDSYGLGLHARGEGEKARGRLVFGHRGESGGEGFAGEITCLSVGEDGVVQVSGITREGRGHRHDHDHGHGRRGDGDGKNGEPGDDEGGETQPAAFANGGRHGGGHDGRHGHGRRGDGDRKDEDGEGDESAESRDFAFTILTKSEPQQFSLPTLAEEGSLTPCGGGDATTIDVTRGGFRARS